MSVKSEDIPGPIDAAFQRLKPLLKRSALDKRPVALMVCGCSGSGKSTLSKTVAARLPSFQRVSIDGILASRHGIYGVDYPASEYKKHSDEADDIFRQTVEHILANGKSDVILDRAFYAREDRDFYRALVERDGGRCVLVYLKAPKEVLWHRINARRGAGVNADSAREISRELLDTFFDGFEVPKDAGEIVMDTE